MFAIVQNDKHLGVLAGLLQVNSPVGVRSSVANIIRRVIADDHTTQWVLAEVRLPFLWHLCSPRTPPSACCMSSTVPANIY